MSTLNINSKNLGRKLKEVKQENRSNNDKHFLLKSSENLTNPYLAEKSNDL